MNTLKSLVAGVALLTGLFLFGCNGSENNSPTSAASPAANGQVEGQLVADAGASFAKSTLSLQAVNSAQVYPLSGVTVELARNGAVAATATTDEYGRFHFVSMPAGEYELRAIAADGAVIHEHVSVNADATLTVYGRVLSGDCLWTEEAGSQWDEMPRGQHWGSGFCGAAPGAGYWHDGQQWCDPHGSGHHGMRQ